jgi:protein involved in polysaccharide export with SLBB domain
MSPDSTYAQHNAVESEIKLTPEAIKLLRENPEFRGLTPEEILKGKEFLEIKERGLVVEPYQDISTTLKQFGSEFFSGDFARFLISQKDIFVMSDYVIGPGDEIKILLRGRINAQYNLVVDEEGYITIPRIGPLRVAGMHFNEMKDYLTEQAQQIIGAKINVTIGALRNIKVYILGEVRRPGTYILDASSTITNALLTAGGPTKMGSLRNIQLKRNHKNIVIMDFYNFLLKDDKHQDKVLQSEDVVFVPTVGPLVGVTGNVMRPAIYELKDKYDLKSLLDMAGGIIPSAYTQQIRVERTQRNKRQIVIDIEDKNLTKLRDFLLNDGDLVKVFPIVDKDVVFFIGNVKHPGEYEYKAGMTVKDLIKDTTELLKETYFEYALIKRFKSPGLEIQLIPFNLGRLLFNTDNNIKLEPQDSIYIFSKWFFEDKPAITVKGRKDEGKDVKREHKEISPRLALEKRFISISGEINFPGRYIIKEGERLSSVLERAGGFTEKAYLRGAVFTRERMRKLQQKTLDEIILRLQKKLLAEGVETKNTELQQKQRFIDYLKKLKATGKMSIELMHLRLLKGSKYDIRLEQGDSLFIPVKKDVVDVAGAVMSQGGFTYSDNLTYKDYIEMAGGYTKHADKDNVYVLKVDGSAKKLSKGFINWNYTKSRWEIIGFGERAEKIEPGDTIVVPEKLEHIAWLRGIKDITKILYQIAVITGDYNVVLINKVIGSEKYMQNRKSE